MSERTKLLIVDDDEDAVVSLARALKANALSADIQVASTVEKAVSLIQQFHHEVAVIDLCLCPQEGVEAGFRLLRALLSQDKSCRVIVLTGHADMQYGVRALQYGAASFVEKPADIHHLIALIKDGFRQAYLRRNFDRLNEASNATLSSLIIGRSPAAKKIIESVSYAAQNNQPVLLTGETGTGKGLCAVAIHRISTRASQKFVRYQPNFSTCDLVNSDLFGHAKGAFTGAHEGRSGLLKEAHLGTFFLDEVSELPQETQVALLGVLQDRKYRALGSNTELQINIRLICAANRQLSKAIQEGRLRPDFYHRIAHFVIELPPLRQRKEDIELLLEHALNNINMRESIQITGSDQKTLKYLKAFDWPGNIRQFETVVEGAALRAQYAGRKHITLNDIQFNESFFEHNSNAASFNEQVTVFKLNLIKKKLAETGGNQLRAADQLGIDRSTLRRLLAANSV